MQKVRVANIYMYQVCLHVHIPSSPTCRQTGWFSFACTNMFNTRTCSCLHVYVQTNVSNIQTDRWFTCTSTNVSTIQTDMIVYMYQRVQYADIQGCLYVLDQRFNIQTYRVVNMCMYQRVQYTDIQGCLYLHVPTCPIYRQTGLFICTCTNVSIYRHTGLFICTCTNVSIYRHTGLFICTCTNVSNIQTNRSVYMYMYQRFNIQTYRVVYMCIYQRVQYRDRQG